MTAMAQLKISCPDIEVGVSLKGDSEIEPCFRVLSATKGTTSTKREVNAEERGPAAWKLEI